MSELITEIFSSFTTVITGLADGLKSAFTNLIYANGSSGTFSPLVLFIFTMAGLGLATGILYKIFGMVRRRRG